MACPIKSKLAFRQGKCVIELLQKRRNSFHGFALFTQLLLINNFIQFLY